MLQAVPLYLETATLAVTPSFVGLRRALSSIFFIFTHPKEIHEGSPG
jgi:hypothetical protein